MIRRLVRIGVLDETRMRLDYVLALKLEDFMERRLQTQVFKSGLAKSVHHARVLIRQRHIRVGRQIVNVPSFVVRLDSQKHVRPSFPCIPDARRSTSRPARRTPVDVRVASSASVLLRPRRRELRAATKRKKSDSLYHLHLRRIK